MNDTYDFKISKYIYVVIIIVSLIIGGLIPPLLGTVAGLGLSFPTTAAGWIVWGILQVCNMIANCLMFYAFTAQGKENIKKHPSHIAAKELLRINNIHKEEILISPQEWEKRSWMKKMALMGAGTLLGGVALTQAVIAFDVIRFIVQVITLTIGLLFGLIQMKAIEEKYTDYYLEYAEQQVRIKKEEEIAAQTTDYLEITTTSVIERTREIPINETEETNNNVSTQ